MLNKPTVEELRNRIQRDIDYFGSDLPERTAIAWWGYLSALIEWGLLTVSEHDNVCSLLPMIQDNPVVQILLGRPDQQHQEKRE
jgi:hypothetical protein